MLSWSSHEDGTPADVSAVATGEGDAGLPHGAVLLAFADAIAGCDDGALAVARDRLEADAGEAFMIDAAAVAANFEMMTRVADGTGAKFPVAECLVRVSAWPNGPDEAPTRGRTVQGVDLRGRFAMRTWWRSIGTWLSRHTMVTLLAVLALTGVFAVGLNKLDFATGQDSYIDPSSQVAKDNHDYQELFGGESMVVLFTVDEGKNLVDLFTAGNIAQMNEVEATLSDDPAIVSVVSPVKLLQWSNDMIVQGTASEIIARTIERDPSEESKALRQADAALTTLRLGAAGEQSFDNPDG